VGLSLFLPALVLILVTGLTADRFNRRGIMAICLSVELLCAGGFLLFVNAQAHEIWPIFAILVALGTARAFWNPAAQSLAPNLVPPEALANAITTNMSAWQFASIAGPAAGGLLYGISPTVAFGTAATLIVIAIVCVLMIPKPVQVRGQQATSLETMFAGFRYIFSNKVVLGAISLDMFAVMLSGAYALMPVYAKDILHAGPQELGFLRAGPGIGAILMGLVLMRFPVRDHAGRTLFVFVALFGAFTVLFGFSTNAWLSVVALVLVGASDMVSVTIRETIMQLWTPEEVRGRVNAVNSVFIGASNELGEFRAGTVAALIGPVPAVVLGGFGAIAVAGIWATIFPDLRNQRHLDEKRA
ncbi:MAG: MFS transporter, partial [Devosia sp.]|nr:MFS transporter [Devosia sp.]